MPLSQAKQALIALAVNELARENDYDSITVDMICKRAQISRSGFYRAFEDKYAVLTWCESFPVKRGLGEIGRTLDIAQGIKVAIEGFDLFMDMFDSTRTSIKRDQRESEGVRKAHELFRETITDYHGIALDETLDCQAFWAARGTLMAIRERRDLHREDLSRKPREIAKLLASCYPPRLAKILDDPVDPTGETSFDFRTLMLQ